MTNSLLCPRCESHIPIQREDGELVTCWECDLDCELHLDTMWFEGKEHSVLFLEPLTTSNELESRS